MTMSHIQRMPTKAGLSVVPVFYRTCRAVLARLRAISLPRTELDDLSEGQLGDIGMRRLSYRERWMDCRETQLTVALDYRGRPDERGLPRGHRQ